MVFFDQLKFCIRRFCDNYHMFYHFRVHEISNFDNSSSKKIYSKLNLKKYFIFKVYKTRS